MIICAMDTETTGREPGDVVEIGGRIFWHEGWRDEGWFGHLVKPSCPIEIEAMSVHHITEAMVVNQSDRAATIQWIKEFMHDPDVYAFHNAEFDRKFLPELQDKPFVCTYRCALHLFPDSGRHSNQYLRYSLGVDMSGLPADAGATPHRALYDAWTTGGLLLKMLELKTLDELILLSTTPVVLNKVRFGKHEGKLWSEVDRGYLSWCLRQADMDPDVHHTARHYLEKPR